MSTKNFFRDTDELVNKALRSLTITNSQVAFDAPNKIVYRRPESYNESPKVSIVCGGGSGHEPGFGAYVGKGLLSASVAGTIFASPSAEQVRRAVLSRVPKDKGVLVLTMQYTGDVLNFGIAAERAKASGIATKFLAIGDDVGVGRAKGRKVGRRGIAGTTLIVKILGALAETGSSLTEVYNAGLLLSRNLASVGASLQRVGIPGRSEIDSSEQVPHGQVEVGMGIHNESGCMRMTADLPELVSLMLSQILDPTDEDRHYIDVKPSDKTILMVNNLGGLSPIEVSAITHEVCSQLKQKYGIAPVRVASGTFLTSLNALGWSVSLLKVVDLGLGSERSVLTLYDAPAEVTGWSQSRTITSVTYDAEDATPAATAETSIPASNLVLDPTRSAAVLTTGLEALIAAEPEVTSFDTIVGDGDCGIGLKRGAEAILKEISDPALLPSDALAFVARIVNVIENTMDGTAGAIFGIYANGLMNGLREQDTSGTKTPVDVHMWAAVLQSALAALSNYTPAVVGDRTFLDSLIPFVETLARTADVQTAAEASIQGAEITRNLKASLGRTIYVGTQDQWLGQITRSRSMGPSEAAWRISTRCIGHLGFEDDMRG
ncbi:dihydroxyacetone kinase Dak1 [Neophaeococcomyces mojaviensis]|uniref:Dihydroxyacetone kinase Dak1 n=1 Tax=Neophaeococcomyces mojaviensis TaxID=3383035 RepID=A0ACC3A884_9EURO|nr:dihydroxyacetone kinase Dak1 [Knufia sp. JES_112]